MSLNAPITTYSTTYLKEHLPLSEPNIKLLPLAPELGKFVAITMFLFVNSASNNIKNRLNSRVLHITGGVVSLISYTLQFLMLKNATMPIPPFFVFFFLTCLTGFGSTCISLVCSEVAKVHFSTRFSIVSSLLSSFEALAPQVRISLTEGFLGRDREDRFLLVHVVLRLVTDVPPFFVTGFFDENLTENDANSSNSNNHVFWVVIGVLILGPGVDSVLNIFNPVVHIPSLIKAILTLLLQHLGLFVAVWVESILVRRMSNIERSSSNYVEDYGRESTPDEGIEWKKMVWFEWKFWLLFLVCFGGSTGIPYVSSLGQIVESGGYPQHDTRNDLVSLASATMFLGRLFYPLLVSLFPR